MINVSPVQYVHMLKMVWYPINRYNFYGVWSLLKIINKKLCHHHSLQRLSFGRAM